MIAPRDSWYTMLMAEHKITYSQGTIKFTYSYNDKILSMYPDTALFIAAVIKLKEAGDLKKFHLTKPGANYEYTFEDQSGHVWFQTMAIQPDGSIISHGEFDNFLIEEVIELHQIVRRLCVELIADFGMTEIKADWP